MCVDGVGSLDFGGGVPGLHTRRVGSLELIQKGVGGPPFKKFHSLWLFLLAVKSPCIISNCSSIPDIFHGVGSPTMFQSLSSECPLFCRLVERGPVWKVYLLKGN